MKALFLDDERWRHDLFEERMRATHDVHHLVEPDTATGMRGDIVTLATKPPYCGLDCVNALIAQSPDRWPGRIIVHSWNSRGAGEMMARLREVGLEPERQSFESRQTRLAKEAEERFDRRSKGTP
jgi:hypothetical protein